MDSVFFQELSGKFPTPELQQAQLDALIDRFGSLNASEIIPTLKEILCFAKLLYEQGDTSIVYSARKRVLALEIAHSHERDRIEKLDLLSDELTQFKPSIFKNIQRYFSELYHLPMESVLCLPKIIGRQMGAKVEIKRTPTNANPILFHVKSPMEFSSKIDFHYTEDQTAKVNYKELFLYKVLEYIGYGPKTHFIIDSDLPHTRVEEGLLIATQDLGYTKKPHLIKKSFKTFRELREELCSKPIECIDEITRRDIIALDMLSRAFLLEDVMINQSNFGMVHSSSLFSPTITSSKWKIVDFIAPVLRRETDDYSYRWHYPGGVNLFHSFRVGNASHCYDHEALEVINQLLTEKHSRDLWLPALERLSKGTDHHLSVANALEKAFDDVRALLAKNQEILHINPDRLKRRMADLHSYQSKMMQNFSELACGAREYVSASGQATP